MPGTPTKVGHFLAKILGIKLDYRDELGRDGLTRGESVYSISSADTYVEEEPSSLDWIRAVLPTPRGLRRWAHSLFPFTHWITRYNAQWAFGDLVAGITVGAVVVPQSMAYALLAELGPEYGLYSSFMGVLVYWFFATSKDITIGPVAVASILTGQVVLKAQELDPDIDPSIIASGIAVLAGSIIIFIGLIRCGWIVDFISLTAISAFMTGSAINIAVSQTPALMGITGFSNREATYKVIINILSHLGRTKLDAAMGLSALVMLYGIRIACSVAQNKVPARRKLFFFIATLRTAFVILLYTMISWLANRNSRSKPKFRILGNVPRGFKHARVPVLNTRIINLFVSELPAMTIVLLIEHIAISKSFGRINHYTIDPSQEMVAIGITNILGPFLGGYPATGSFSRTAIKSKAGVRTPFAGVITAIVVLLAIYALPAVFFYIPSAALSAVIIHAVGDLITPPNTVYQFWRVSPLEVIIFFAGVFVTIFTNIENGIYTTICISLAVLLFRVVKAKGRFLGRVKIHSVLGDQYVDSNGKPAGSNGAIGGDSHARSIFMPVEHQDGTNPQIDVESPYPGIFIYRFSEGFNYPNANHYLDFLVATIFKETRKTNAFAYGRLGDRPWNDPGPKRGEVEEDRSHLPTLKAVILDFSSVNNVDITSVQHLIDVRNQLDRWAAPNPVEWHLAHIINRWTKRALVSAGFGYPTPDDPGFHRWKPIFSVAELGGDSSAAAAAERRDHEKQLEVERSRTRSVPGEHGIQADSASSGSEGLPKKGVGTDVRAAVVQGINRPFFHIDLTNALQSAIASAEWREIQALGKDDAQELGDVDKSHLA
ncbi:MAG: Sulfate permease 2 [Piccolia ochrophora]|nr:MAG: Sulfate permease 2 [Piccolia ochrophora]